MNTSFLSPLRGIFTVSSAILLPLGAAQAHPSPAQPPEFGSTECITVVDKREMPRLYVPYGIPFDDTEPEPDKISLPDSKTHQFFAFRGSVIQVLPDYEFWPATPTDRVVLPVWINDDDLQRAEAANTPMIAPQFSAAAIGDDVLVERPEMAGAWLEVSPVRRPITIDQAMLGVYWDLADVPAGVYQIATYIFSPPFNGWEPRPGVIKVIDGTADHPAITVEQIDDMLYAEHGRRVEGCLDTPAGSTMSGWYRIEGSSDWLPWLTDHPVMTGPLDLCFVNPDPSTAGTLRLRIAVRAPDGTETYAFSPDTITQLSTPATTACTESNSRCCAATGAPKAEPASPMAATPERTPDMTPDMMPAAGTAAPQPPAAAAPLAAAGDGGCSAGGGGDAPLVAQLALLLAIGVLRRRR